MAVSVGCSKGYENNPLGLVLHPLYATNGRLAPVALLKLGVAPATQKQRGMTVIHNGVHNNRMLQSQVSIRQ